MPAISTVSRQLAACCVLAAVALLSACSDAPTAPAETVRPVKTIVVSAGTGAEKLVQTGEIRPSEETSLGFRIDGRIVKRLVDVGAVVKAGDVLATLDPSDSENQLKAAKAQLDSAVTAEKLALSNFKRLKQLAPGGAVSAAQLEQAQSDHEASLSARKSAEANVTSAQDRLNFTALTATSDGVVSAVTANPGQVVSAGQEVVRLAALAGRDAVFDVSESLVNSKVGHPTVLVSLLSDPSIQANGRIRDVSPVADPVTRTIRVRVTLEQPPAAFGFGATVQGSIDKPAADQLMVPASAMTRDGTEPAVYVVDPASSQLQLKQVSVSRYSDTEVFISAGLVAGERVVVAGVGKLRPGLVVSLLPEPKSMSSAPQTAGSTGFNLSSWALANQQLVAFLLLVVMACGVLSYDRLPRNEDPAFTIKTAVVSAGWPGATVLDTMNLVTEPMEKKLQEIPYLDFVESYTKSGEAVVFLALKDNTPPEMVPDIWYKVRKKMQDLAPSLPAGVSTPGVNDEFDDTFGTIFGFVADGFSPRELREYVEDMRTALLQVPNVGKIDILGVEEEQIVVEFSPRRMAGLGLDPAQVMQSIQAQNAVTPTGVVRTDKERISLRVSGAFTSEQSIRDITLRLGDRFVALSDIATVSRQLAEPPVPLFKVNGDKALGLAISMAPTGNMLEFGQAIRARMATLAADLPHGIELHVVADQSAVVKDAVGGFLKVLIEAIVIVLAVSFVSLGTRAGLVVAVSVPVVLAMTFVGMELADIGLQRISLGALIIALGLLVDDAMITVEAMVSRLEAGWDLRRAATYAYETTAFPMLTGTLVMIAGFIPVGFASSSAGEYCFSLFMVVLIALMSSWIVAVLFSPLLGVWLLKATPGAAHPAPGRFMLAYDRLLTQALAHRGKSIALALGVFALALVGSGQLQEEFFPASDRPELLVSINLPQNSAQAETARRTAQIEQMLKADPDVSYFSSYIGSGAIRFYLPMDVLLSHEHVAQIVVVTKGLAERDAVRARLEALVQQQFSDLVVRVSPLELGPPVGWPLKYRVMGPDIDVVRAQALALSGIIGQNANTRDVNMTAGEPERTVLVEVNQTEARAAGFSSEDVASALATIFSGQILTSVRDGKRLVNVVVRGQSNEREDLATVANLQIRTADGRAVPLRQIANVSYGLADPMVWRRQRQAFITVQADIAPGMTAQGVVNSLAADVAAFSAKLPAGYQLEVGGAAAESEKGNASIFAVLPVTMLVMLVLLMIQLKRISRTVLAFITAPFGLIGIVLAMLPTGTPMGFVALLGCIALAGMIIRNAVILISEVDTNVEQGMARDEAIMAATRHRARPILLTAAAAILGMIPIATQVFWGPMAYAIIGGLFAATILTLTVLPCALSLLMQRESKAAAVA